MNIIQPILRFGLLCTLIAGGLTVLGQDWQPLGSPTGEWDNPHNIYADTVDNLIYAGGSMRNADKTSFDKVRVWDGQDWQVVATSPTDGGVIFSITRFQDNIYAGGSVMDYSGVYSPYLARWDGNQWYALPESPNSAIFTMLVHEDTLYVGGYFDSVGSIRSPGIAKWDGTQWHDVYGGIDMSDGSNPSRISGIANFKGNWYASGKINDSLPPFAINLLYYNGTEWTTVPGWKIGLWSGVPAMDVFKDKLYLGGTFFEWDNGLGNNIVSWDGQQWDNVGGGFNEGGSIGSGEVIDLHAHGDYLYAVGRFEFTQFGETSKIARWDGKTWCDINDVQFDNDMLGLTVLNDDLYVAGGFWTINGDSINYVAMLPDIDLLDTCEIPTNIKEKSIQPGNVVIFPNPTEDNIRIIFENAGMLTTSLHIEVLNSLGQKVQNYKTVFVDQKPEITISLTSLPSGVYFISVLNGQSSVTKKIVKY